MKIEADYFLEEQPINQERTQTIKQQEYAKLQKRLRRICYLFQYLAPTLYVAILLLR
jgi:hypothetical protein